MSYLDKLLDEVLISDGFFGGDCDVSHVGWTYIDFLVNKSLCPFFELARVLAIWFGILHSIVKDCTL